MELPGSSPLTELLPPGWLVEVIRSAEQAWQESLPVFRRMGEETQEQLARLDPGLVAARDFSIGTCNLRPSAARLAIMWALEHGLGAYLGVTGLPEDPRLVEWILDPAQEDRLVLCLLGALREAHPDLQSLPWDVICAQDDLIAKLYSGYMGAGGAWGAWQASLAPGAEAQRRLGCLESDLTCREVQRFRPTGGAGEKTG
jgi:hypothetical protein